MNAPNSLAFSLQALHARAAADTRGDSRLTAIRETLRQPWPRCAGERIDPAEAWSPYFTDEQVVAWLEAGVFTAAAAIRLDRAGYRPRDLAGQHEIDVTLGLAFARGEITAEQLLRRAER